MSRDPRIDSYIERQQAFAQPILRHLRELMHSGCPEVEESIRWGAPAFLYRGRQLAMMAAFKAHASFSFRGGHEVVGDGAEEREGMGQFGRLGALADLPEDETFVHLIHKAIAMAEAGVRPQPKRSGKALTMPDDLQAALTEAGGAADLFASLSSASQRDYLEWITGAKRADTRARRIADAVLWIGQGKRRNWKYERRGA